MQPLPASLQGAPGARKRVVEPEPETATVTRADEWRGQVAEQFQQFRALWISFYGGKPERLEGSFLAEMQDAFRGIAETLLALLGSRPAAAGRPSQSALMSIVVKLQELSRFDLDPDSPSVDAFDELGPLGPVCR